jgi:hypothetical protein
MFIPLVIGVAAVGTVIAMLSGEAPGQFNFPGMGPHPHHQQYQEMDRPIYVPQQRDYRGYDRENLYRIHRNGWDTNYRRDIASQYEHTEGVPYGSYHQGGYAPSYGVANYAPPRPATTAYFISKGNQRAGYVDCAPRTIWRSTSNKVVWQKIPDPRIGWTIEDERELRAAYRYFAGRG